MIYVSKHIQLQNISLQDQPKLMELVTRVYTPVYKHLWKNEDCNWYLNRFYSKENLQKELKEDAEYYFVIYNSKYVGIIRIQYNKPLIGFSKKSTVYFNRIYLGSEAQGKGVAKAIFNWVELQAKRKGENSIWLKCMDSQQQALHFYTKQDYKHIGNSHLDFDILNKGLNGIYIFWKSLK